ncbi:hypothetical protein FOFC_20920 [Fusarium oxysporum]|nr:hypothetical protein FOFC_20920 [Fusarium oxysporum]
MVMNTALQRAAVASPMMRENSQRVVESSKGDFAPPEVPLCSRWNEHHAIIAMALCDRTPVGVNLQLHPGPAHDDVISSEHRPGSRERVTWSQEPSEESRRVSARNWLKAKRSPTSPILMSPEELPNLSTPRHGQAAKRSQTASIPHPNELPPALAITVDTADTKLLPDDIPPRSATEPPQRSMQARNGPVIGLSATPRVMRLIIEGNHDQSGSTPRPDVPSIPAGFSQKYSPESSSQQSPEREAPAPEPSCQIFR